MVVTTVLLNSCPAPSYIFRRYTGYGRRNGRPQLWPLRPSTLRNRPAEQFAPHFFHALRFSGGMNVSLPRRRSDTDGDILDSPTETAHRVTFEMGQHYGKVIFRIRLSHKIFFQMLSPFHGQRNFSVRIHDDYRAMAVKPWSLAAFRCFSVSERPPP